MNKNGTRFGFINAVGEKFDNLAQKANHILLGINESKAYLMRYEEIKEEYRELCKNGDIDEFSSSYAFKYHIGRKFDSPESREAMYLEVRQYLLNLRQLGEIK